MPRINLHLLDDDDPPSHTSLRARKSLKYKHDHKPKRSAAGLKEEIAAQSDSLDSYHFTYHASRHEQAWLIRSLGEFYENRWIQDVQCLLKGGKEASVYQCRADPSTGAGEFIAAKVYRPRMFRQLKKDHIYREGRLDLGADGNIILDGGMLHAMHKGSAYGQELRHTSWIEHEFKTLELLHAAGADVPRVYASDNNAILMEYVGDPWVLAPALNDVTLEPEEARPLFERVVRNIDILLEQKRIHADLSAYNILYWDGDIWLIDFPQAIHPDENRNAFKLFERDVRRICEYFARQGVAKAPRRLAAELWVAHGRSLRPDVHPGLLDDRDEADLAFWRSLGVASQNDSGSQ
jgi:RIO kinase 1